MSDDGGKCVATILGCGSSGGVPRTNGDWGVCDPSVPENRRTRCSLLIQRWASQSDVPTNVLVDTSPDMRQQLISANVRHLDAVLYTHDHADQTHGIDDLRSFAYAARKQVKVHLDKPTYKSLSARFGYCFEGKGGYPAILDARIDLEPGESTIIHGPSGAIEAMVMEQDHGFIRSLGFRFGDLAYCNDVVRLPEETFEALKGVTTLILDTLRYEPHPTHAHLDQALSWIERVAPEKAILTNLHIDLDYNKLKAELPRNVSPAFDGMQIQFSH